MTLLKTRSIVIACLTLMCLALTQQSLAQDSEFGTGLSVKKLWLDYLTFYSGETGAFNRYDHGVEIGYSRSIMDRLNLYVPVKLGEITREGEVRSDFMIGLDAQLQYYVLSRGRTFNPYVLGGLGLAIEEGNQVEDVDPLQTSISGENNIQIPLGLGVDMKFHRRGYLNVQLEYRPSTGEQRNNINASIGWKYLFGPKSMSEMPEEEEEPMEEKKDSDMDGITDDLDLCPQTPGLEIHKGCPDTDEDGIMDPVDECPELAGPAELNGCPDSDGDGVSDNDDECPTVAGTIANNGCPDKEMEEKDTDGDGVPDRIDRCPNIAGVPSQQGCPPPQDNRPEDNSDKDNDGIPDSRDLCPDIAGTVSGQGCPDSDGDGVNDILDECPSIPGPSEFDGCPDSDGDGIADKFDDCPSTYGLKSNNGCPEIAKEDQEILDFAMRAVQFDSGSDNLKAESYNILDQVAQVMQNYPDFNLEVAGHTDSRGEANLNQRLSERRAKACYEYLLSRGLTQDRMTYAGYGESKPIATNDTPQGRSLNRRTEFTVFPRNARR